MSTAPTSSARIVSLDQFRGYTVLGMFVVNFLGSYAAFPFLRHHHSYCSYADTIMPQFFFAVGFAYRLTLLRRTEKDGRRSAYWHIIKRCLGLMLVALIVHRLDGRYQSWSELENLGLWGFFTTAFQRNYFQTLTHIAVASLWVLPVIAGRPWLRVAYMIGSAVLFHYLSETYYYEWVMRRPGIDGGPLGFLTWTIPLLVGSLAYDAYSAKNGQNLVGRYLVWATVLMLLGYGLSCINRITPPANVSVGPRSDAVSTAEPKSYFVEPPFVPPSQPVNIWTMSQRAGSVSYLIFSAGFSLLVYALFVIACDRFHFRLGIFETLGSNALAAYIIHGLVDNAISPFVPRDAPSWYLLAAFGVFFWITYTFVRYLEKNKIYLRL